MLFFSYIDLDLPDENVSLHRTVRQLTLLIRFGVSLVIMIISNVELR